MSTDTEGYPRGDVAMSEIPEFVLRSKKPELTLKELEYQCQKLGEENHQLQLRILGVNELARLLQDRNELVAVLKERNKRLEMSLVRLENRCATFERQIKSQKNSGIPSIKQGQSPFIPGPSPKILEGLMQENLELKKTVNNLKKKGSSGYLEAVKTTQLEEFIEQQKLEIDQLRGQINSLTAGEEDAGGVSDGGGMSLPSMTTDSGPLRRQLIKMQQTMSVKDRFCSLLSQQVTELQKKLASLQSEKSAPSGLGEEPSSSVGTEHVQETQPPTEEQVQKDSPPQYLKMLEELKSSLSASKEKITNLEGTVNTLNEEKVDLQEKFECTSQLYSTLLSDNSDLRQQVESFKHSSGGSEVDGESREVARLKREIEQLQKTMDSQVDHYTQELKSKNLELNTRRIELEETNLKFAQTDSMLMSSQAEIRQKDQELNDKISEVEALKDKIDDLEDSVSSLNSANADLQRDALFFESELKKVTTYNQPSTPFAGMKTGGGGVNLIGGITSGFETVKDSLPPGLKCRNPEKSVSSSSNIPLTQPPQQHIMSQPHTTQPHLTQPHISQMHGAQPHTGQVSKPPGPLHIPPPSQHMPSNTGRTRSPGPLPKGHMHMNPPGATPTGSAHAGTPMGRPPFHSNSTPTPLGPSQYSSTGQGPYLNRAVSAGSQSISLMRPSVTMPINTFSGTPPPRVGTPNSGASLYGSGTSSGTIGMRYASTPGIPRVSSGSGAPPIPPRSTGMGYHSQTVFGLPPNFPPLPRPQHTQQPFHRSDIGYSYHSEMRDRNTPGSTSPHPSHDSSTMHPYNSGGNGGPSNSGPQPPHYQ